MFEAADELFVCQAPAWEIEPTSMPVTSIDYSGDGSLVAFANSQGTVKVVNSYDGILSRTLTQTYTVYPVAGCKFHPNDKDLLLAGHRDGSIFLYNVAKSEVQGMSRHLGSGLMCVNIDPFGESFAIACADGSIRLYDMESLQRTKALTKVGMRLGSGQTVNTYALMFNPDDPNIIVSATGNDRVLVWDVRTGGNERTLSGPHIKGPALDMYDGNIFTGSYRDRKQIEVWDFGTGKKLKEISIDTMFAEKDIQVTTLKVARNGLNIVAGGSGANRSQVFGWPNGLFLGQSRMGSSPTVCVAMSPFGASFVQGNETGSLQCYMVRLRTV